jgi:hypothetical protein
MTVDPIGTDVVNCLVVDSDEFIFDLVLKSVGLLKLTRVELCFVGAPPAITDGAVPNYSAL